MLQYLSILNRYVIHANIPFTTVENDFFKSFLHSLRPMYTPPSSSRFELAHYTLKSEAARVMVINMEDLDNRKGLTLLCDGWEGVATAQFGPEIRTCGDGMNPFPILASPMTNIPITPWDIYNFEELRKIFEGEDTDDEDNDYQRHHGKQKDENEWTVEGLLA